MPHNKSQKINNQQNEASLKEEAVSLKPEKNGKRPPSLNGISKNLP